MSDMITNVFKKRGECRTGQDTFNELVALCPNDKYKKQKAAGSMGGAAAHNYIKRNNGNYECMRDPREER